MNGQTDRRTYGHYENIRQAFFYLVDYVTRRSEKLSLKKRGILHDINMKLYVFCVFRNH